MKFKNFDFSMVCVFIFYSILILALGFGIGCMTIKGQINTKTEMVPSEQFGGATPMQIYTIFDRDTGVYYAVTEKGGICVMQTMSGETKLVDQGDGTLIHKNKGEASDAA